MFQIQRVNGWVVAALIFLLADLLNAEAPQEVVNGAKKEGRVVFYTTLGVAHSQPLLNAFQKKYPFVQPELLRLAPEKLHSKIVTESKAGRHAFDVVSTNVVQLGLMLRERLVLPYRAVAREDIPVGLKDNEGYWTAINLRPWVLAYNTKLVAQKEVPKDWWDLLDPKWKRKIEWTRRKPSGTLPFPNTGERTRPKNS
jgi:iron(III) transport system substrate-binding protein